MSAQAGNGKPVRARPWGDPFDRLTASQLNRGAILSTAHGFALWFPALVPMLGESSPYSAFIRAIIFLFAALSFRFRRSLGFSKC